MTPHLPARFSRGFDVGYGSLVDFSELCDPDLALCAGCSSSATLHR